MKVRIVVKPSKVLNSDVWHYQVEEFINGKWHLALIFDGRFQFYSGAMHDKDEAIECARESAKIYIEHRKFYDHMIYKPKETPPAPHVEEIKIEQA